MGAPRSILLLLCAALAVTGALAVDAFEVEDARQAAVVGAVKCVDCSRKTVKFQHAYNGLHVAVKCKSDDGAEYETMGMGHIDRTGQFKVALPAGLVHDGELTHECRAELRSAVRTVCPGHEPSTLVPQESYDGKHTTFTLASGKIPFSSETCVSLTFLPKYDPFHKDYPKYDPFHKDYPKYDPFHKDYPKYDPFHKDYPKYDPFHKDYPKYDPFHKDYPKYDPFHKDYPKFGFPPKAHYFPTPTPVYTPPVYTPPVPEYKPAPVYTSPTPVYTPAPPVYTPPVYTPAVPAAPTYEHPLKKLYKKTHPYFPPADEEAAAKP